MILVYFQSSRSLEVASKSPVMCSVSQGSELVALKRPVSCCVVSPVASKRPVLCCVSHITERIRKAY